MTGVGVSAQLETNTDLSFISRKDSDEKYRLLVENVNDSIVISQKDKFIYFNKQFADLLGYRTEELMMKDYRQVYSKKSLKILAERNKKRKNKQYVSSRYETTLMRKDGNEVSVEANVTIVDYNGEKATFAVIRDMTASKLAEKELAAKEQRYRILFELSPTGLLFANHWAIRKKI
jgi:PAS domain S-box-containing protein